MCEFRKELEQLINIHSCENGSDTPDFILAEYLLNCLDAFDLAVRRRGQWWGHRKPEISIKQTKNIKEEHQDFFESIRNSLRTCLGHMVNQNVTPKVLETIKDHVMDCLKGKFDAEELDVDILVSQNPMDLRQLEITIIPKTSMVIDIKLEK